MTPQARQLTPGRCKLGESPVWSPVERCLYWIDIEVGDLWRFDPASGAVTSCAIAPGIGALTMEPDGGLALFLRDGEIRRHPDGARAPTVIAAAGTRFNDAVCDRTGRVYCGVMPAPGKPGCLLRLEAGREPVRVADPLMPNGGGFSPDGATMYFTDTLRRTIHAAAFDERAGSLTEVRKLAVVPHGEGVPDGLVIDREGGVWSARHDAGLLVRYDASGAETHRILLPTRRPTGMAFGGDELAQLYVATAHVDDDPGSGALYCIEAGFRGEPVAPSRLFGG